MPCDSAIAIKLSGKLDAATLVRALTALKLSPVHRDGVVSFAGGRYVVGSTRLDIDQTYGRTNEQDLGNRIQRAYTREGMMAAARRQGFRVEADAKDPDVFRLTTDGRVL